jgi:flavin-dependent dehydrogenase
LDVLVLEKERLPREKLCAGWITPAAAASLKLDLEEYAAGRTLQPITGFLTGLIGRGALDIPYGHTVGYGIRRCEFDSYLARRSGARIIDGMPATALRRDSGMWVVNERFRAPIVIGAGGHHCPLARCLGADPATEEAIVAQEVEFRLDDQLQPGCRVRRGVPELYFCRDLKGYGWCFLKGQYLNIGLGRADARGLHWHVTEFVRFLESAGRVPPHLPGRWSGHAYLLRGASRRVPAGDGALLVGDAAGLAREGSGEGIGPAVVSGLLAAQVILQARGDYRQDRLSLYGRLLDERLGGPQRRWAAALAGWVPGPVIAAAGSALFTDRRLARRIVLDGWFLGRAQSAQAKLS